MPVKTLPDGEVRRLLKAGRGPTEIVNALREQGIDVTPNAITMWARRHDIAPRTRRYDTLLPWTLNPRHKHLYAAKMLRLEGRRRAGAVLLEPQMRQLETWRRRMDEAAPGGVVVHYLPDSVDGFVYTPRRPGIDTDLIRVPGA